MRTGGTDKAGTGGKVKWAYFGKQRGASGKIKDLGWVRVGSAKWRQYVRPVKGSTIHTPGGQVTGPHRAGLVPKRYAVTNGRMPGTLLSKTSKAATGLAGSKETRSGSKIVTAGGKTIINKTKSGNPIKPAPGAGPKNPPKSPKNPSNPKQAMNLLGGNGSKVGTIIPRSMAAKMAALQFAPQISQTKADITQGNVQAAQDLHDISNWYGQATAQSNAGQAASQQQAQQGAQSDQNTTSALLAAIGGGANAGAGQVAAAGQNSSALQNALATIAGQGASSMSTALSGASAGASAAQQALNDQANTALQQQLTSLQGQQGDAQASALMQIIQANNATLQQRFSNKLSSLSAAESAAMLPGQLHLQNQQVKQARLATKADASGSGHIDWAKLDAATQLKLAQSWMSGSVNGVSKTVPMAVAMARARAQGYTVPAVQNFLSAQYQGVS